jgi:hypothetical protein
LGEVNFTVNQEGGQCGFSVNTYSLGFASPGGDGEVAGSPTAVGCTPDYGTDSPQFIEGLNLTGPTLNIFRLNFSIAPFQSLTPATRFGLVTFGGQVITVKQKSY